MPDGTLVGFSRPRPPYGALAERAVVAVMNTIPAPVGIDPAVAVVLSSGVTGFAIKTAAGFKPGETVLVQGATGVAGRLAVQVARLLGAGRIIATGRDDAALREVSGLGAETVINTTVSDDELVRTFKDEAGEGYDVVLDFLWDAPPTFSSKPSSPSSWGPRRPSDSSRRANRPAPPSLSPLTACAPPASKSTESPRASTRKPSPTRTAGLWNGRAKADSSSASSALPSARSRQPGNAPTSKADDSSSLRRIADEGRGRTGGGIPAG